MTHRILTVVAALVVAACSTDPVQWGPDPLPVVAAAHVSVDTGSSFRLRPGEYAAVAGGDLLVGFRGVRSDSRCPEEVTCVWQGDAEVIVGTAEEGESWSWQSLHTGVEPRVLQASGFEVRLVEVEPAALSSVRIEPEQYRIVVEVTGG